MKRFYAILTIIFLAFATQCSQPGTEMPAPEGSNPAETFAVTPNQAVDEAREALAAVAPATRSGVAAVRSVVRHGAQTAVQDAARVDPSLYVVNFADDGGFAIVAADRRQPATVYAVSDEGAFPDPEAAEAPVRFLYERIHLLAATASAEKLPVVYGPWVNTSKLDAMVKVRWGTGNPYNCTTTRTTAYAQVMSYYKRPWQYNWSEMVKHISTRGTAAENYPPAYTSIRNLCASLDANPVNAIIQMGYTAYNAAYDYSRVKKLLDEGNPVIIDAATGIQTDYTDFWIVDGYLERERYPQVDPSVAIRYPIQKNHLLHCNMCCDGVGNGYYLSSLLDMSEPTIPDPGTPEGGVAVTTKSMIIDVISPVEGIQKW